MTASSYFIIHKNAINSFQCLPNLSEFTMFVEFVEEDDVERVQTFLKSLQLQIDKSKIKLFKLDFLEFPEIHTLNKDMLQFVLTFSEIEELGLYFDIQMKENFFRDLVTNCPNLRIVTISNNYFILKNSVIIDLLVLQLILS